MIRLGLLSTARINTTLLGAVASLNGQLTATHVASRDIETAEAFAARWSIPVAVHGYLELLEDPDVDAVYVSLPASLHGEWAIRALEAGKHVLCEKPFSANAEEAVRMVRTAQRSGRVLMEAMHYRYHPLVRRAFDIAATELGPLSFVEVGFWHPVPNPLNIRRHYELGGGATMDFGCYALHWLRTLAGAPKVWAARGDTDSDGIDYRMDADIEFAGEVRGRMTLSMEPTVPDRYWLHLEGRAGTLDAESFVAPTTITVRTATGEREESAPLAPLGFRAQLEHFCDCIATGTEPLTGGSDSIANMAAIDDVYRVAGLPLRRPYAEAVRRAGG